MPQKTASSGYSYAAHYADVHLIVRRGDEILMSRRVETQRVLPGMFQVPAGLMEEGEPAAVAAAREFAEETGAAVDPADVRFVHLMHHVSTHAGDQRIAFFFETDRWHGEIGNPEPDKCEGWETGTRQRRCPSRCRRTSRSRYGTSPPASSTASTRGPRRRTGNHFRWQQKSARSGHHHRYGPCQLRRGARMIRQPARL